jgi:hypothetical protein
MRNHKKKKNVNVTLVYVYVVITILIKGLLVPVEGVEGLYRSIIR